MAMQVAGICYMPPVAECNLAGRRLVDHPDLFAYEMNSKAFASWQRQFRRLRDRDVRDRLYREGIDDLGHPVFVMFKKGSECVVLSSLDATQNWPGEAIGDRPDALSFESWDRYRAQVVQWVADALDNAYEVEVDFATTVSVTGRVSSSRGMTLRPGTLVQRASFTSKAVMEPRLLSVEAARDAIAKTPFKITSETYDGESADNRHLMAVTTEPVWDGRLARAIWDSVAVRPMSLVIAAVVAEEADLNALVDEALQ
jgi:hypothetical protein